jgi:osmotically-inducible protein OsmY
MRRKYLGLAIAAITAFGPASAFGGDREIAEQIMTRLKISRDSGELQGFTLDMKVEQGVVLFRGSVSETEQKQLVLKAAEGIDGIEKVVDEVSVVDRTTAERSAAKPMTAKPTTDKAEAKGGGSLREMLSAALKKPAASQPKANSLTVPKTTAAPQPEMIVDTDPLPANQADLEVVPGRVMPTAAVELASPAADNDQQVVAGVVKALGQAQQAGQLKGFGVDVKCSDGVVNLIGRASSNAQRDTIIRITESVPGVQAVDQSIDIIRQPAPAAPRGIPAQTASHRMAPVNIDDVPAMAVPQQVNRNVPVTQAAGPMMGRAQMTRAQMTGAQMMGSPSMGTPMQAGPVPMNYGGGMGAPRYDSPNLPNYAWPGYASHPNYAALTYPQQYSPSAWPYIGPFYPYPQVPLGWRKVSLEWDDGWWFLDFTDR